MGDHNKIKHLVNLQENNQLLHDADIIATLKKCLDYGCHQLENLTTYVDRIHLHEYY